MANKGKLYREHEQNWLVEFRLIEVVLCQCITCDYCYFRYTVSPKGLILVFRSSDELVCKGMNDAVAIDLHLKKFVKDLFKGQPLPSRTNRRYFPSKSTVQHHIRKCLLRQKHSPDDQANLQNLVQQLEKDYPSDNVFFRAKADGTNVEAKSSLLFVHQTEKQRRLLARYGRIVLLDATYKTTKYAIPLFFLVVKTNVDYQIVATFIVEDETTTSIAEALRIVKGWNHNNWQWKYFMTDFDMEEINAIEMVFEGNKRIMLS